ncbi:radical SAM protein [Desulfurococcaceae archaeon MEX13E-LK6-19]|nr:radical SAM protein [Desulfurococcaceae archaeon MEX13E-LK6-19]
MAIKMPSTIIWIFTTRCNLSCRHCYAYRLGVHGELSRDEKLRLVDVFADNGVKYIGLSGGEPLIHPDTRSIIERIGFHGIEAGMVTNGIVWNNHVIEAIKRHDVFLYVSLDGPKELHEAVRGNGTFDRILEFIKRLQDNGIDYALVMAINNMNYKYADYIVELGVKYGANHVAIIPVMPSGKARVNKMYVTRENYINAIEIVDKKSDELGYPVALWCTPFAPLITKSKYVHSYYCRTYDVLDIDPAGNMLACDVIDYRAGNLRNKDFKEAWREYTLDPVIKSIVEPQSLPQACRKCPLVTQCRGGCFARSYLVYGDYNKGDPLCPRMKRIL